MTESGLGIEYISKPDPCDRLARNGDLLEMHYTGTLEDGKKFDSSYDRSEPFKFQIGVGQVIKGWEQGVVGMCVGEKRRLIVPPTLGYGDQGAGDIIPGGATLHFDVELMGVEEGPTPVNVFKQIDMDGDKSLTREEISSYLKQQVNYSPPPSPGPTWRQDVVLRISDFYDDSSVFKFFRPAPILASHLDKGRVHPNLHFSFSR